MSINRKRGNEEVQVLLEFSNIRAAPHCIVLNGAPPTLREYQPYKGLTLHSSKCRPGSLDDIRWNLNNMVQSMEVCQQGQQVFQ